MGLEQNIGTVKKTSFGYHEGVNSRVVDQCGLSEKAFFPSDDRTEQLKGAVVYITMHLSQVGYIASMHIVFMKWCSLYDACFLSEFLIAFFIHAPTWFYIFLNDFFFRRTSYTLHGTKW